MRLGDKGLVKPRDYGQTHCKSAVTIFALRLWNDLLLHIGPSPSLTFKPLFSNAQQPSTLTSAGEYVQK